jgi:very-short-patch-repair endonuclease
VQDAHLIDRAKKLRNASTPFEALLWKRISHSQLGGHKFRRQHVIGNCIVDFFCPARGLIVEIDGDTHDRVRDAVRDARHAHLGFVTLRFTNADVGKNLEGVLTVILELLRKLSDRWPHPNPSPEGDGK